MASAKAEGASELYGALDESALVAVGELQGCVFWEGVHVGRLLGYLLVYLVHTLGEVR